MNFPQFGLKWAAGGDCVFSIAGLDCAVNLLKVGDLFDLKSNSLLYIFRLLRGLGVTAMNFRWGRDNGYLGFHTGLYI